MLPLAEILSITEEALVLLEHYEVWATIEREPKVTGMAPCKLR